MRPLLAAASLASLLTAAAGCHFIVPLDDIVGPDGGSGLDAARVDGAIVGATASVSSAVGGARMSGGVAALGFNCDAGCALDDLRIETRRNVDLLFHRANAGETNEQLAGISYFDYDYSWRAESGGSLTRLEAGPPVAQVMLTWTSGRMYGTGIYTLHPDGRLHRFENISVSAQESGAWLLGYTAVSSEQLPTAGAGFLDRGDAGFTAVETELSANSGERGYACASNPTTGEAVAWVHRDPTALPMQGWRVKHVDSSFLLASDWIREGEVVPTSYLGHFLTILGDHGCEAVPELVAAFADPPQLELSAGSRPTKTAMDWDDDGFNEGGGYYELSAEPATGVTATLPSSAVPLPSCTMRIQTSATTVPTITLDSTPLVSGRDFLAGRGSDAYWVYLGTRWEPGAVLSIQW